MEIYINGMACISHHDTVDENYFFEDIGSVPLNNQLIATEPNYKDHIPANLIRRMSHIVKMGVSTGMMSMKSAGLEEVDAIVTGTGMGCCEDTDKFLRMLLDNDERFLTPTSFIQSTHNTVAGQIALQIKCNGYNFTYVHQNLSFEYALLDAMMLLKEQEALTVLVGAVDEITPSMFELFYRGGHIKKLENVQPIWNSNTNGYIVGEGAGFFNISRIATPSTYAKIKGVKCIQGISDANELTNEVNSFLAEIGLEKDQISLVLSGNSGDVVTDKKISEFNKTINLPIAYFKHLCGEYFTSSTFALWLAANIIKRQVVPNAIFPDQAQVLNIQNILIVNHHEDNQYSLMCISKC
ncbi:MAG: hypothetical protein A3F72_20145 [Bacteroidetes bacterium RIFCSPLOWO2_12_FULL_35_15]|nr:MAG: hypothetical protein A3F72_20145 [Bacteroidetes bacterium RIFCSPLOWO2_12_FULL_35_15]